MNAPIAPVAADTAPTAETAVERGRRRSLGPLRMVLDTALAYPSKMAGAGAALAVTSAATLAVPYGLRMITDSFAHGSGGYALGHWFQLLFVIVVILGLGTATRFYFVSWLGERVVADIRMKVQANLLSMPPSFFEENSPREISSRMTSDTAIIEQVVGTTVSIALRNAIMVVGGVVYLFAMSPALTAELLIGIPVVIGPITIFGRQLRNASRKSQDRVADVGMRAAEVLGAMKVVQAFGQEGRELTRFGEAVESTFAAARRRILLRSVLTSVVILLVLGGLTGLMWQAALQAVAGKISGGTILAFVFTGALVAGAFQALTEVYGDLVRGAGAAERLSELLRVSPEIAAPPRPITMPSPPRGQIAFQNVTFRYPTRPEVAALNEFSLAVEPGETVAVVGPSGAGKSTLFLLAERFYDPQAGTVRIDGVPLREADPHEVRARMAMVPQEGVLFAASARDNLRYGKPNAGDEEIWSAARAANAEDFLRDLPDGLDTFLGEDGTRLSGGQRQRIAIARALLRDAPILLLDEATSALDAESERLVQDALDRLMKTRTTLVIAHRLATIRQADRIIVMNEGRIVEQGTHTALAAQGGLYARLARLQFDSAATLAD
jgi:ATP-binding cassette subfamily B protein